MSGVNTQMDRRIEVQIQVAEILEVALTACAIG
jgi:hypothetical protein